jgi:superfamily II DNA or RNA helicase
MTEVGTVDARTARQEQIAELWFNTGKNGTVEAVTGFGKTKLAVDDILQTEGYSPQSVLVTVPTRYLKGQWEDEIQKAGLNIPDIQVVVINTAIKSDWNVDLLIMDEIHNYAADTFYDIFSRCTAKDKLGLTAILERKDGRHDLLKLHCPIIDTVNMAEARKEGYVSAYRIFNLGLTLNPNEESDYKKYTDTFNSTFAKFNHDFGIAMAIYAGKGMVNGIYCRGSKQAANVWSKKTGHDVDLIIRWARQWGWAMSQRKQFLYTLNRKIDYVVEIAGKYQVPTIVFSETTKFADEVATRLGRDICRAYHTQLRTEVRTVDGKLKKFGTKRQQTEALELFNSGEIRVLSTARALDEGFNVEGIELAIMASYTSAKRQNIQRMGRALRYIRGKKAMIINMYVRGSQEEKWLKEAQGSREPVVDISSVQELDYRLKPTVL